MRLMRSSVSLMLATVAAACSVEQSKPESAAGEAAKTDKTFKPTQYSVADFYANKGFFGASFSPDRQRILVASNTSGIWNAYAVPVAGGDLEPLTKSTTNSIFAISYFPADLLDFRACAFSGHPHSGWKVGSYFLRPSDAAAWA